MGGTPDGPGAAPEGAPRTGGSALLRQLRQRRHFLVDRRRQLRAGVLTTATALALVVLLNLSIYSARTQGTAAIVAQTPELAQLLRDHNRLEFGLVLAASAVFVVAVFMVTILETHKTAGAAYNLVRQIERVRDGDYSALLVLRKDDNLHEVEHAFNEMTRALRARARSDAEGLQYVAELVERIEEVPEAREAAQALAELAAERQRRIL
jgi:methyl-accepting chemotaxis protein